MKEKARVIYHKNCYDGFAAAWCLKKDLDIKEKVGFIDEVEYVPYQYNEPIPETKGFKWVYIVDMSFKRDIVLDMCNNNDYVFIYDHHKTAEAELRNLEHPNLKIIFDMNRSGAKITKDTLWIHDWYFIDYIQDRDLWKFELPHSKEVNAFIRTIPFEFDAFDYLCEKLDSKEGLLDAISKGEMILNIEKGQQEYLARYPVWIEVLGNKGVAVNAPMHQSETANLLLQKYPDASFAACYIYNLDGTVFWSLRSDDSRADVSTICQMFKGGGHRNAAGCQNLVFKLLEKEEV